MDEKMNYQGQALHADPDVDATKLEKEHRAQARAKANSDPIADLMSVQDGQAQPDNDPDQTVQE